MTDLAAERVLDALNGFQVTNVTQLKSGRWKVDFLDHGNGLALEIWPIHADGSVYEIEKSFTAHLPGIVHPPDIVRKEGNSLFVLNVLEFEILSLSGINPGNSSRYVCRFVRRLDR